MLRSLLATLALLATMLPALPAQAATVYEIFHIPTVDGATIRVEVVRDPANDPQPVILTYSPYNNLGDLGSGLANDSIASRFVPQGYARAFADVLGTRGSTGCWDYGGEKETQSGVDVVNWLSEADWSNGNVGMIGVSYEGTTANMVASRGEDAPGLKAIVPIAAISRWYGYAYSNGVRYFLNSFSPSDEGFDTPLAFDFGFGRTVPPDPDSDPEGFANALAARAGECGAIEHTQEAYSPTPDYDDFWLARDYLADSTYRASALVVHGWQDFNVKQEEALNLWDTIPVDDPETAEVEGVPNKYLWLTQSEHANGSGEGYNELLEAFFAETLLEDGGDLMRDWRREYDIDGAIVRTAGRDFDGDSDVRFEESWPPAATTDVTLHLGRWFDYELGSPVRNGLVGSDGETGVLSTEPQDTGVWTWTDLGLSSELVSEEDPLNEPGHGYYSLYYQTPELAQDVRIAGRALLDAWVRPEVGTGAHLTPVLLDVAPDGTMHVAERGFLNLDYRNGLGAAQPLAPGEWGHGVVDMLPQDYTFRAGHRIGLLVMSSNRIWAVPGTPQGTVNIANGPIAANPDITGSSLVLPVVDAPEDPLTLFTEPAPTPPANAVFAAPQAGRRHDAGLINGLELSTILRLLRA